MPTLVCLGLGYCARHYVTHFGRRFDRIVGTTRTAERAAALAAQRFRRDVRSRCWSSTARSRPMRSRPRSHPPMRCSFRRRRPRPATRCCPRWRRRSRLRPGLPSVVCPLDAWRLSGLRRRVDRRNHAGRARQRAARQRPHRGRSRRGKRWARAATCRSRSCGSAASTARARTPCCGCCAALRSASPSPATSRTASMSTTSRRRSTRRSRSAPDGIFNIVDDEPAPPTDQIAFAAQLLGIEPPAEIPYADAAKLLSPFALSFYDGCIRARNDKLKRELGVTLRYPNYREGLRALHAAGDHLAADRRTSATPGRLDAAARAQ